MNLNAYLQKKIVLPQEVEKKVEALRKNRVKIVTLNGSFDLLHAGHLHIIFEAKKRGDLLFMMINSDASIQANKGANRPIVPLQYRLEMLASLELVDFITWFEERDPRAILEKIKPDVHVNGVEYGANCVEADVVRAHGGSLHLVERVGNFSTSDIIKKMKTL